jgi:NAD(P)H-hydrate epimerase
VEIGVPNGILLIRGQGAATHGNAGMNVPGQQKIRFFTESAIEIPALTAEQMREVDRVAMEETGPNLYQMMENAGRNFALLAIELLGKDWERAKVLVLAGPGGNGGGGICAARHLANRRLDVRLCLADLAGLREVAAFQRKVFQSTGGKEIDVRKIREEAPDLILDALIGYGLKAAPDCPVLDLIRWANGTGVPILALDVPSGVNATTGQAPGEFIKARWTMTLALPKTGLWRETTGDLFLADIGIPEGTYRRLRIPSTAPFGSRFWVPLIPRR